MKRSQETIEEQFKEMKKMFDEGANIREVAAAFCLSVNSVYNTFSLMGFSFKKPDVEKLVYADNSVKLEKVTLHGKWQVKDGIIFRKNTIFTDVTPVLAPR